MPVRLREGLRVEEIDGEAVVLDREGLSVHRFTGEAVEALRLITTDAQTHRVLQIATHQVEYTADMGAVLERHLSVHGGCVARNHAALQRAFAARGQPPPMALDFAARGLQVLVEGLVHQWLLNTEAFDLQANGRAALDVYLGGLGLHDTAHG